MIANTSKLKQILVNTGLQEKDNPLYQFLRALIDNQQLIVSAVNPIITIPSSTIVNGPSNTIIIQEGNEGGGGEDSFTIPGPIGPQGVAGASGTSGTSFLVLSDEITIDDILAIPGPPGPAGNTGSIGPTGPAGTIIFPEDGKDGDEFPPIVGPQGNPGPTGAQGPIGPVVFIEDGLPGEDGLFVTAAPASGGGGTQVVFVAQVDITDAQIKSLNTTPITVIAAPGVGKIILPVQWSLELDLSHGTYSGNPSTTIQFSDGSTFGGGGGSITLGFNGGTYKISMQDPTLSSGGTTTDFRNLAIQVKNSADQTGGGAGNSLRVTVLYQVINSNHP